MSMRKAGMLRLRQMLSERTPAVPAVVSGRALLLSGVLLTVLLLSACAGSLPRRPAVMQTYDFGVIQPPAAEQQKSRQQGEEQQGEEQQGEEQQAGVTLPQRPTVVMHPIAAPRKLAGQAMLYRLEYRDRGALRPLPYSQSRWADAPASLLQALLQAQLSTHYSLLSPVQKINMTAHTEPALQLRMELLACSQVFYRAGTGVERSAAATGRIQQRNRKAADSAAGEVSSADIRPVSEAVLQVRVVISRNTGTQAQLLHNRILTVRVPAGHTAATGAEAMQQAAMQLAQQVQALLAAE